MTRCALLPGLLLLAIAATGTASAQVRVLASGADRGDQERFRAARAADELRTIAAEERLVLDAAAVDFAKELAVVLWYGDGRGGQPAITVLDDGTPAPRRLLRITGAVGAPRVQDRWVAFTLPAAWEPWRTTTWFETDATSIAGDAVWREVLAAREPAVLTPFAIQRGKLPADVQCFTDAAAYAAFAQRYGGPADLPAPDFAAMVMVAVQNPPPSFYWLRGEPAPGATGIVVRRWQARDPRHDDTFAWLALPRRTGVLDYEEAVAGETGRWRVASRCAVPPIDCDGKLPLLRLFVGDAASSDQAFAERATTLVEWRALRQRLGGKVAALPDDFGDFTRDCVVAVVFADGRVFPGLQFAVTEEEGVDVLSVVQSAPSGVDPGQRTTAAVVRVKRRKGQLAIVVRTDHGPATGAEKTLKVFPGFPE